MTTINLNLACIEAIDITPAKLVIDKILEQLASNSDDPAISEPQLQFEILYPRELGDPRELSEIPEVRLWFVRLDALYPWLPYILDWRSGELTRYAAMLVPHQFSSTDGIVFNPEALELFVMHKVFSISLWLKQRGIFNTAKLQQMTQSLGYEIDREFFNLL
ncbi:CRR6 family NdhI maturation factor [Tumidithrix elongata RA019]|uniref:CRR6 family NdhI maturation factor n=1 Tax=Tumidithrix elongata BACA0141 TaxID=2716417 RepID=A0AAW9Q8V4_9CYAN|nr:CRR6 family NdhI maturation factor [Tumidithrix elongata RA019]